MVAICSPEVFTYAVAGVDYADPDLNPASALDEHPCMGCMDSYFHMDN